MLCMLPALGECCVGHDTLLALGESCGGECFLGLVLCWVRPQHGVSVVMDQR